MAHSNSAKKRIRQNETARHRNRWRIKAMREAIKNFNTTLANGSVDEAKVAFVAASKVVDKTASKGPIHKKQAARRKSRMNAALKKVATA
ncbi:MAG: small subunit ribosomal protein S20 [Phycisphaerales bacterium]|jgi:small subunit ribosomal protein S20